MLMMISFHSSGSGLKNTKISVIFKKMDEFKIYNIFL